ncbi:Alpha/Beta hydrolase protein [Aspergillus granulosus]|uniref:Alpha/Beta hydrolase protein n=1 Tax=Aspergillus granulosus TaxID=176169 RepID=A0ABR4I072_9EURO
MDGKALWESPASKRNTATSQLRYWTTIVVILLLATLLHLRSISRLDHVSNPLQYDGESLQWKPCGQLTHSFLECSSVDVPMDQFNATNSGNKTFNIALIRLRGSNATQNLLLNPGGPGGSGYDLLYLMGEQLKTIVGEGFHLISFDPRGVNRSTPAATCYPDKETRRELSLFAWTQNFVKACVDTIGEHAAYINTPQTAADMNSILDALGQEDMFYWGFSYGTLLGQTYAQLYPERSKRVVIDGVANQFKWYSGGFEAESQIDADAVLDGFFEECMKAGWRNCPLSSLAETKDGLAEVVLHYMDKLRDQPVSVYLNNTNYGLLDYNKVWYNGVFMSLYSPSFWPSLANNLYNLIQGNATDAFRAYSIDIAPLIKDDSDSVIILNDSPTGPAHWPQDRQGLLDTFLPLLNNSRFPASWSTIYYMRQQWLVPRTHSYVPRGNVKTAHPLLILSTTYDPVCPLAAAHTAAAAFLGSRIIEVKGYGHCSIAVPSVCLAKHLRAFYYEGVLPDNNTQCEVDAPYFIGPGEDENVGPQEYFEDEEDRRIRTAQMELARVWDLKKPFAY